MNLTGYTFNADQGVVIGKRGRPGLVWSHNRQGEA